MAGYGVRLTSLSEVLLSVELSPNLVVHDFGVVLRYVFRPYQGKRLREDPIKPRYWLVSRSNALPDAIQCPHH